MPMPAHLPDCSPAPWVVVGGAFTIWLANVLGHKCTVDCTIGVLVYIFHPYSHGYLRPRALIGGNVFLFWEGVVSVLAALAKMWLKPELQLAAMLAEPHHISRAAPFSWLGQAGLLPVRAS